MALPRALTLNNTNVTKVIYNGVECTKVIYNGSTVWEKTQSLTSVSIAGTAEVGQVLTANPNPYNSGNAYSYQWYRGNTAISGATGKTYTLTASDRGYTIKVSCTLGSTTVTSSNTAVVKGWHRVNVDITLQNDTDYAFGKTIRNPSGTVSVTGRCTATAVGFQFQVGCSGLHYGYTENWYESTNATLVYSASFALSDNIQRTTAKLGGWVSAWGNGSTSPAVIGTEFKITSYEEYS